MLFTALSPNTQKDDFKLALDLAFSSKDWFDGKQIEELRKWFRDKLSVKYVSLYESARTGLFFLLKEFGIGRGDEVILQGFTCVAAVNPIKWTEAKPVFADINSGTYNIDTEEVENKITDKTKAILIQHTFGYPAEIEKILEIAKKKELLVIEDCAHTIGGKYKDKYLGRLGDAAIFSLGRDKGISSAFGGVVITNRKSVGKKLMEQENFLAFPEKGWIRKQLLYTVTSFLTKKYYDILSIGKLIHYLSFKLGIIERSTQQVEKKQGGFPKHAKSRLPNAFAKTALNQLEKLGKINKRRKEIARIYMQEFGNVEGLELPEWDLSIEFFPLRFPLQVNKAEDLMTAMRVRGVELGDWYDVPVAPKEVDLLSAGYKQGSCPAAEEVCSKVVNLPIHVNMSRADAGRVVEEVKTIVER